MSANAALQISVLPGDGIGSEVIDPTIGILKQLESEIGGFALSYGHEKAGAAHFVETGTALPEEAMKRASEADAILLGAMGMPDIRYPDGREIAPQLDLREEFELFAGVRPVKTWPGMTVPLADPRAQNLDFVLIRESTEGIFAGRGKTRMDGDDAAHDSMTITRRGSERLFDFAFDLTSQRKAAGHKGQCALIDKANVLGGFAYFRRIFEERAKLNPDIEPAAFYVDATALNMVRQPWMFDVMVTENMFGDILSDLGAGLMGGIGMAPSADIGARHAVFQPCHGSAPDIVGQGKANPVATFLSAAMMLDWLGHRHGIAECVTAGRVFTAAVEGAFAGGALRPFELGGSDGTKAITGAVVAQLESGAARKAVEG
jgi:3-isopropylmalate dehydrogenase